MVALLLTAWNYFDFLDSLFLDAVLGVKSAKRGGGYLLVREYGG